MLTYAQALDLIAALPARTAQERVALGAAVGRTLAAEVLLDRDQPPFDRATMDGYAVCLAPGRVLYRVVGTVAAGSAFGRRLKPGEAVRIMTGAPVPVDTTVVPVEATNRGEAEVMVSDAAALLPGRNIARRGEDGRAGEAVLAAGLRLTPPTIALAAMAGAREVAVQRAPRLAIVTTGDEVGAAGASGINDSNGPLLEALASALGLSATRVHARDDEAALREALASAAASADVVVTTGGVSAGARDLVVPCAQALGFATVLHHVNIQPGKPVFVARREPGALLVGLPGNPVSVLATAHLFLLPALARLGVAGPSWIELPLTAPARNPGRRQQFLPARVGEGGVRVVPWNGSGDLIAAAAADGLVDLQAGCELAAGTSARVLPWAGGVIGARAQVPGRAARGGARPA